ncbi:subtilisin family serine protease [Saccharothrix coeruleofusca]|uniref:S8 family serine peptidase n=1 Tax=Saccharothrix coeruleofusca TaxID=33919 RepID=UPI001AE8973D|nr:S8 family serine peptidase [Saccharothrix coeruleofusca]MBP2336589.1 subtilisin family serine protease [Saccharothrix coeruleofusca]
MSSEDSLHRWGIAAAVALLAASGTPPASAATAHDPAHDPAAWPVAAERAAEPVPVTLITGDRVVLKGERVLSITPGPGREGVFFHHFQDAGREHVVPSDALPAMDTGKLDRRLFDITGLVEAGYDDAHRDTVPLLVTGGGATHLRGTRSLTAVDAVAGQVAKTDAATAFRALMADPGVDEILLDGVRQLALDRSTAQIGAPSAWEAGLTGEGVVVAVLDTGVDGEHPDLVGRELAEANFSAAPDNTDTVGHGTHVASTIASTSAKYRGVAPGARLLDGKVCETSSCSESAILAGMQWAVDQGADIVNLSLGGVDTPAVDPLEEAVDRLSERSGALFVIAAGNSGRPGTIDSPGSADAALTVGAVDRRDAVAHFSSRGPRVGDGGIKPDVTAPGVDIVAAKAAKGGAGTPVDEHHVALSGTSMATPHVAGAAALLAQRHPDWSGSRIKTALTSSARPNPASTPYDQGTGRIDVAAALTQALTAEPASLSFGNQRWPHHDDAPVTRELVYRNTGTEPVALSVTAEMTGPDGEPAPAGLVTASPAEVTVPAGGQATVTVTADTRVDGPDGGYAGLVTASGGTAVLRTPMAVVREVESYDLTFQHLDANGQPAQYGTRLFDVTTGKMLTVGSGVNRLPAGDYLATASISTGRTVALLFQPDFRVGGDAAVTMDARAAKPVRVTAPDPTAQAMLAGVAGRRVHEGITSGWSLVVMFGGFDDVPMAVGHLGPEVAPDRFATKVTAEFATEPTTDPRVRYRFAWGSRGKAFTGLDRAPAKSELAEVRTTSGLLPQGRGASHGAESDVAGIRGLVWSQGAGPTGESVDYVTTEDVRWTWYASQWSPPSTTEAQFTSPARTYRPGRRYEEGFNRPVFGPVPPERGSRHLHRAGDRITFDLPLFGDGAGHTGTSLTASARTALFRGGELVGETATAGRGDFDVPAGGGDFRLETRAVRATGVSAFSTEVSGSWTFRSEGGDRALPLTTVRFAPRLDATGSAPAGGLLPVPLVVGQQVRTPVRDLRVEVSFDDGGTWSRVRVLGNAALVRNPDAPGTFASLRVEGSDTRGNAFRQSVLRAYRLG